jgi:hypothetical protein
VSIFVIIYFLFIIWTFFLLFYFYFFDTLCVKKKCPNNKKKIYNDKYRHTRDRLFGLYATLGWISWKSMHFSWKDDSPLWIFCVSWCQIERAARLRLRLGNLLHLHAIRDSKTWNDSDKTSMTAGNFIIPWWQVSFFSFYGKQLCLKNLDCI